MRFLFATHACLSEHACRATATALAIVTPAWAQSQPEVNNGINPTILATTFGFPMGKVFGGDSQIFIKPQILAGANRPADWGLQVG